MSQVSNGVESTGNDVRLKDLLDIPEPFQLQSPLPLLNTEEKRRRMAEDVGETTKYNEAGDCYQLQDV